MYDHRHIPNSYADDFSIRRRYRLPESSRARLSRTKRCTGTVMLPERNREKFTDLYPSSYEERLIGQHRSLGRCNSTMGNSSYSQPRPFSFTQLSSPQHGHLTRSQTMPHYQEESQVSHRKGWCISQMSKWHVTLLSGWSSTHMIGCYFNLFTDGPIKYFDSTDSTHTFKLDVTCPTLDEDTCDRTRAEACDNSRNEGWCRNKTATGLAKVECKDNHRRGNTASKTTHHTHKVDNVDLKVSPSNCTEKRLVSASISSKNAVEKRFKEIAESFNQEARANGSDTLELVNLTFNANVQSSILGESHMEPVESCNRDAGKSHMEPVESCNRDAAKSHMEPVKSYNRDAAKGHMEPVESCNRDAACLKKLKKGNQDQWQTPDSSKVNDYTKPLTVSSCAYSRDVTVSPLIFTVSPHTYSQDIIATIDSKQPLDLTSNACVKGKGLYSSGLEATPPTYSSHVMKCNNPPLAYDTSALAYNKPPQYNKPHPTYEMPGLTYNTPILACQTPPPTNNTPSLTYNTPRLTYSKQPPTYDNPGQLYNMPALACNKPSPTNNISSLTYGTPCLTYSNPPPTYNTPAQTYDTKTKHHMTTNGNIIDMNTTGSGSTVTKYKASEHPNRTVQGHQNRQPIEFQHNSSSTRKNINEHIRYTPAMITSTTPSYLSESSRCAEIPGEGQRSAKYHSSSMWKDAVSNAWRGGMSASWRHGPACGIHEGPSSIWRSTCMPLVPGLPDKEVATASSGKYYTLRDEVSLRLSAVYSMGVRVTRAIIGRHTEIQPTPNL